MAESYEHIEHSKSLSSYEHIEHVNRFLGDTKSTGRMPANEAGSVGGLFIASANRDRARDDNAEPLTAPWRVGTCAGRPGGSGLVSDNKSINAAVAVTCLATDSGAATNASRAAGSHGRVNASK